MKWDHTLKSRPRCTPKIYAGRSLTGPISRKLESFNRYQCRERISSCLLSSFRHATATVMCFPFIRPSSTLSCYTEPLPFFLNPMNRRGLRSLRSRGGSSMFSFLVRTYSIDRIRSLCREPYRSGSFLLERVPGKERPPLDFGLK